MRYQKYGLRPNKPIILSDPLDYIKIMTSVNPRTRRFPGAGTLSWESDRVLRDPNKWKYEFIICRFCMPILSQMGSYAIYRRK